MKKVDSVCVVILHYNNDEMTMQYVRNLKSLNWEGLSCHYIVVDNASPDGSGKGLFEEYIDDKTVDVLLLEKNEGFARGNNAGIRYALDNYDADLIMVSNNDIIIDDPGFPKSVVNLYKADGFDVFGPDIYSTYRKAHQSPISEKYLEVSELKQRIIDIDKKLNKLRIIDKLGIYELLRGVKRLLKPNYPSADGWDKKQVDVVIQGAFFVLSKGYLDAYPDGLYPGTFLYMEEDILNYRTRKKGLKTVYDPSIKVKHLEGAATRKQTGNRCKKYIFELEQTRKSCLEMINLLERDTK